jgi:transposase
MPLPSAQKQWDFAEPLGQHLMVELPFSEIVLILQHVKTSELHTYLSAIALGHALISTRSFGTLGAVADSGSKRSLVMPQRRYELSDFEWSIIAPLLPNKPRGVPRVDDRKVLNGIYWRLRSGSPWADIPERYGPATTCYNRFVRWRKLGVWDRIFAAISAAYDGDLQMIDSSSIRVHQHAANGKKGGPKKRLPPLGTSLTSDAWGVRAAD